MSMALKTAIPSGMSPHSAQPQVMPHSSKPIASMRPSTSTAPRGPPPSGPPPSGPPRSMHGRPPPQGPPSGMVGPPGSVHGGSVPMGASHAASRPIARAVVQRACIAPAGVHGPHTTTTGRPQVPAPPQTLRAAPEIWNTAVPVYHHRDGGEASWDPSGGMPGQTSGPGQTIKSSQNLKSTSVPVFHADELMYFVERGGIDGHPSPGMESSPVGTFSSGQASDSPIAGSGSPVPADSKHPH